MKNFYCLLLCLTFWGVQAQVKDDLYDLKFRRWTSMDFPWSVVQFVSGEGGCVCFADSLNPVNGAFPLSFRSREIEPGSRFYFHFLAGLSQQMYLPGDYRQLTFELTARGRDIRRGWLKVTGRDAEENLLRKDSVEIVGNGEWNKCMLKLPAREVRFCGVEICVEGGDDWQKASVFNLGCMRILGDDKEIDWSGATTALQDQDLEYSGPWPGSVVAEVKNKRIVALAETVHGYASIGEAETALADLLIDGGGCRLVLLELPYDLGLMYNLYIQGNTGISEEEIKGYMEKTLFRPDPFLAFLNKVRAYNRLHAEKVYVIGIDRMTWETVYLRRFLACASGKGDDGWYKNWMKLIREGNIGEARRELSGNKALLQGWEEMDVYWLNQALKQLSVQEENRRVAVGILGDRDRIMKENIIGWVDSLLPADKQALIIGHWCHFNKVNTIIPVSEESAGYYLNQRYGDDYHVIGILAGEGELWGPRWGTKKAVPYLLECPTGEEFLENRCRHTWHFPVAGRCRIPERVGWIRLSGSYASRIFYVPVVLSRRMDGFLWVK